jgi:ABC-type transporter Mla subunit MlaD
VLFRERFDGLTDKVDKSLAGISALFSELNDERTINAVKGTLENVEEITRQMAAGEGLVGALLSDEEMKADFGVTLRSLRDTAAGVDTFVGKANRTLGKLDEKFQPLVDDASATVKKIREVVEDLKDPNNKSLVAKLLYDEEGKLREDVEQIVADAKEVAKSAKNVAAKIERGEGTLGKFVNDPKVHDDIVKLFQQLDRNTTFKRVTRYAMEAEEGKGGTPEPAPAPEPAPEPEPLSEGETAAKPAP